MNINKIISKLFNITLIIIFSIIIIGCPSDNEQTQNSVNDDECNINNVESCEEDEESTNDEEFDVDSYDILNFD